MHIEPKLSSWGNGYVCSQHVSFQRALVGFYFHISIVVCSWQAAECTKQNAPVYQHFHSKVPNSHLSHADQLWPTCKMADFYPRVLGVKGDAACVQPSPDLPPPPAP